MQEDELYKPLDTDVWNKVQTLFDTLVELPAEQQESSVDDLNTTDEIKSWLHKLLRGDRREHGILDQSIQNIAGALINEGASFEQEKNWIGEQLGLYRIVGELGRGGMSLVMLAERADGRFEKQVALKLIRSGPYTSISADRLNEETRILAKLQHPNIAYLLDAGVSEEGVAFTAMELCHGCSLTEHCATNNLSIEERLLLLRVICQAVDYAHQNLIVHRDLKPSNILVQTDGVPKLVDFGIAGILNKSSESTIWGALLTPSYAAPEQFDSEEVTTASDIYALGSLMYELLTGRQPFDESYDDLGQLRQAKQNNEYVLPSVRVLHEKQGNVATGLTPNALHKQLKGDLDAIVQRAMSGDKSRRYASAQSMSNDIGRFFKREPVKARNGGRSYQLGRWLQRHKLATAATAGIVFSLMAGLAVALWQANVAQTNATRAETVQEFLVEMFTVADPFMNQEKPIPVNTLVGRQTERIKIAFADQPEIRLVLQRLLADVQSSLGNYKESEQIYSDILQTLETNQASLEVKAEVYSQMANQLLLQGDNPEKALDMADKAISMVPLGGSEVTTAIKVLQGKSNILSEIGRIPESVAIFEMAMEYEQDIPLSDGGKKLLGSLYMDLSSDYADIGRIDDALIAHGKGMAIFSQVYPDQHPEVADAYSTLGRIRNTAQEYEEGLKAFNVAVKQRRSIFGPKHTVTLRTESWFAITLGRMGCLTQGIEYYESVIDRFNETYGAEHISTVRALQNLTGMKRNVFAHESALSDINQVLAFYGNQSEVARHDAGYALALTTKGHLLYDLGDRLEGQQILKEALEILRAELGEDHKYYFQTQLGYLPVLLDLKQNDEAMVYAQSLYEKLEKQLGSESQVTARAALLLAASHKQVGDESRADQLRNQYAISAEAVDQVLAPQPIKEQVIESQCELASEIDL